MEEVAVGGQSISGVECKPLMLSKKLRGAPPLASENNCFGFMGLE
jgi:hypothetical protein